jgi:FlaA1/EpsC-like NDP-sugar epimerase
MGASKRVMEDVAFDVMPDAFRAVTSARFANVAFSNGSLLQSFLTRIEKGQPLATPVDTRRYFITHAEAAEICLLACLATPDGHVLIPKLRPHEHLLLLQDVAQRVLRECGYEAWFTHDEAEAKRAMDGTSTGKYPVLLTPLDTSGEKPYEEFLGEGEQSVHIGFESLLGLRHVSAAALEPLLAEVNCYLSEPGLHVDKERLTTLLLGAVPSMRHVETGRALDSRM